MALLGCKYIFITMYLSLSLTFLLHSYSDALSYLTFCRIHLQTMHQIFSVFLEFLFHNNFVKMVETSFVKIFLYCIDNYYIWPPVFCGQIHVTTMFNLSPITMATNDVVVQNTLLLIDNIVPHKTCLKPRAWFLIKAPKVFWGFNT